MRSVDELIKAAGDLALIHGEISDPVAKTKSLLALAYIADDEYDRALYAAREAWGICEQLENQQSELGLDVYYRLGKVIESKAITLELQAEAKDIFEKVFIDRQQFDLDNPPNNRTENISPAEEETDSTYIYYDECTKKRDEHDYDAAIELLDKCLLLRRKKFGSQSPALTSMLIEKADILKDQCKYDEAKTLLNELLNAVAKTTLQGRLQLPIADILNALGNLHRILLQFSFAEESYQECLMIRQDLLPKEGHVMVGSTFNNLAELYREMELYPKSIEYHLKALNMFERTVGKDHPGYANALGNYGITLKVYSEYGHLQGKNSIEHALFYMNAQSLSKFHPWLVKFGNEKLFLQAQEYLKNHDYSYAIGMYNILLQRKLAGKPTKEQNIGVGEKSSKSSALRTSSSSIRQSISFDQTGDSTGKTSKSSTKRAKQHVIEEIGHLLESQFSLIDQKYITLLILEKYEIMLKACEYYVQQHQFTLAIPLYQQCQYYSDHLCVAMNKPLIGMSTLPVTSPGTVGAAAAAADSPLSQNTPPAEKTSMPLTVTTAVAAYAPSGMANPETRNLLLERQERFCQDVQWMHILLYYRQGHIAYALELLFLIIPVLEGKISATGSNTYELTRYYLLIIDILVDQGQCDQAQLFCNKIAKVLQQASDNDNLSFSTLSYQTTYDYLQYDVHLFHLQIQQGHYDKAINTYDHIRSLFMIHPELRVTVLYWKALYLLLEFLDIYGNFESIQKIINYMESVIQLESNNWYYSSSEGKQWYIMYLNKKLHYASILANHNQMKSLICDIQILLQDYWMEIFTIALPTPVLPSSLNAVPESQDLSKGVSLKALAQKDAASRSKNLTPNTVANYPLVMTTWMADLWYVYGIASFESLNYTEGKEVFELVVYIYKSIGINACHRNLIQTYLTYGYYMIYDAVDFAEGAKCIQYAKGMHDFFYPNQSKNPNYSVQHEYFSFQITFLQALYDFFVGNHGSAFELFGKAQEALQEKVLAPSYWSEIPHVAFFFPLDTWGKSLGRIVHNSDMIRSTLWSTSAVPTTTIPGTTAPVGVSESKNKNLAKSPIYMLELLLPCWKVGFSLDTLKSVDDVLLSKYLETSSPSAFHASGSSNRLCRNKFEIEIYYFMAQCKMKFHEYLESRQLFGQSGIFAVQYYALANNVASAMQPMPGSMSSNSSSAGSEDGGNSATTFGATAGVPGSTTPAVPLRHHTSVYRALNGVGEILSLVGQYRDAKIILSYCHHFLALSPIPIGQPMTSCTLRGLGNLIIGTPFYRHKVFFKVSLASINMMRILGYYVDALNEYDRLCNIYWPATTSTSAVSAANTRPSTGAINTRPSTATYGGGGNKIIIKQDNFYLYSAYFTMQRDFIYAQIMVDRQKFLKAEELLSALEKPIMSLFSLQTVTWSIIESMTIAGISVSNGSGSSVAPAATNAPNSNSSYGPNPNDTLISYWHYQWKLLHGYCYLLQKKYVLAESIFKAIQTYLSEIYKRGAVVAKKPQGGNVGGTSSKAAETFEHPDSALPKKHIFSSTFYYYDLYWIQNHITFMILYHSTKVNDQQQSVKALREDVLPFFQKFYYFMTHSPPDNYDNVGDDSSVAEASIKLRTGPTGSVKAIVGGQNVNYGGMFPGRVNPPSSVLATVQHISIYQAKGRMGLLMNSIKKDSGRKLVTEALKFFDEYQPFPLPYDHPCVMELGGYTKATSKDRLSKYLQEEAMHPWAFPTTTAEILTISPDIVNDNQSAMSVVPSSNQIPKSIFIDLPNNSVDLWGLVHYYGTEFFQPLKASISSSLRGSSKQGARSRSPSPGRTTQEQTVAYSNMPASVGTGGGVDSAEYKALQERLEEEIFLRKQKEDEIDHLKHEKMDLSDAVEEMKLQKDQLQVELKDSKEQVASLQKSLTNKQEEFTALLAKFKEIETELNKRIQKEQDEMDRLAKEEELLRKEKEYQEALKNGTLQPDAKKRSLRMFNREETLAMERNQEMFDYTQLLVQLGHYYTAKILFAETEHLYRRILQKDLAESFILLLIAQGKNFSLVNQFTMAFNLLTKVLPFVEEWHGLTVAPPAPALPGIPAPLYIPAKETPLYFSVEILILENHYWSGQWHNLGLYERTEEMVLFFTRHTESPDQEEVEEKEKAIEDERSVTTAASGSVSASTPKSKTDKTEKKAKKKEKKEYIPLKKHRYHSEYELLLGKSLALLAIFQLYEGKYLESKISIEKSQISLLKGSHNQMNTLDYVENNFIKGEIYLGLCKPKDTLVIVDQNIMILKILLKQIRTQYEENPYLKKQSNISEEFKISGESKEPEAAKTSSIIATKADSPFDIDHPYLARCYLIAAKALIIQTQYLKARQKLALSKKMLLNLNFPKDDLRLLEIEYYEGIIHHSVSNYYDAKLLFDSLLNTLMHNSLRVAFLTHDQLHLENKLPRVPLSFDERGEDQSNETKSTVSVGEEESKELLIKLRKHPFVMKTYYALALSEVKLGHFELAMQHLSDEILSMHIISTPVPEKSDQEKEKDQQQAAKVKTNVPKAKRIVTFFNNSLIIDAKLLQVHISQCSGRYKQSVNLIEDLYYHCNKLFPTGDHHVIIMVQYYYAEYHFSNQAFDDATQMYQDNINSLKTMYFNMDHGLTLENELALIRVYIHVHDHIEATNQLMSAKNVAANVYGGFLSHEVFLRMEAFESILLLHQLKDGDDEEEGDERKEAENAHDDVDFGLGDNEEKDDEPKVEELDDIDDHISKSGRSKAHSSQHDETEDRTSVSSLPYFEHEKYLQIIEKFIDTIEKYELLYKFPAGSLLSYPRPLVSSNRDEETNSNHVDMSIVSPFLQYFLGLYGEIQLLEFLAFQAYFKSLSTPQKEFYYALIQGGGNNTGMMLDMITTGKNNKKDKFQLMSTIEQQEWSKKRKHNIEQVKLMLMQMLQPTVSSDAAPPTTGLAGGNKKAIVSMKLDPPGKSSIELAVQRLKYFWQVETSFYYLLELQDVLMNLSLQYDDIQIAQLHYFTAQKYQAIGQYRSAEISFQEALIVYNTALGLESCLQSSIIAELIYQLGMTMKAVSSQYECMKALFFLSMKIYKNYINQQQQALSKQHEDDLNSRTDEDDESIGGSIKSAGSKPIPGPPATDAEGAVEVVDAPPPVESVAPPADEQPLQQNSVASAESVAENGTAETEVKVATGEMEVNDPFIWKNIFALTSVFVDQKLYHDAFAMHLQLHELIIKAIGVGLPNNDNGDRVPSQNATTAEASQKLPPAENLTSKICRLMTSNLSPANANTNGLILSNLVKAKIAIANDLLNLYRYQEAYNYNEEALELLRALSKIINSGIINSNDLNSTTNLNGSNRPPTTPNLSTMSSVSNSTAIVANSELSTDSLAQYLIEIYNNYIEIYDYLGQFQISDDYIQQIETIFSNWQRSIDELYAPPTDPYGMPLPLSKSSTTNGAASTAVIAPISRPNTNHKPNKPQSKGDKKLKNMTGEVIPAIVEEEEDQYDATQLSKFVHLRTIQAQFYVVLSKHHMIVHKFNEAQHFLSEVTSLRMLLFNPHATLPPSTTTTAKKQTGSQATLPGGANATGMVGNNAEYSNAKLAELRQQSFSIVKVLLVTDIANLQVKAGPKSEGNTRSNADSAAPTSTANGKKRGGKSSQGSVHSYFPKKDEDEQPDELDSRMQTTNEDILQDFQSTASNNQQSDEKQDENKDGGGTPQTSPEKKSPAFSKNPYNDIKLLHVLFDSEHKTFHYQGKKIPSHPLLLEVFALLCQYNMLTNRIPQCTEYLNLVEDMLLSLYEYGAFPTNSKGATITTSITGYTLFIHRISAKLKQCHNQLVDCKALYLSYLEKQIQYNTNSIEFALGISDAFALLGKFSLLLGHFDDSMQYLNDSLKIERNCYARNFGIVITTFTNALAQSSSYQNSSGNSSSAAMLSILPKAMTSAKINLDNSNRPKTVTFTDPVPQENNGYDAMQSLLANSTTFSTTNKDYHYRIQSLLVSCAEILYTKGFFQDSMDLLDSVVNILKNIYGHDLHGAVFRALVLKARCLMEMSKYPEAFALMQQCKSIGLIVYQEHHYQFGLLSYYFAFIYKFMGKVLEAKQSLESSIKCIRSSFGKYHYYTVQILLEMGINFMELGKYMTSEHVLNRAIHLLKKSFGKDHMIIAYGLNALGELQIAQGFLDKVTPPLEEALFISRKNMQTDRYPLIPVILSNMAVLKSLRGVYDLAIQGYDDCIAMLKLIFKSPNHYYISRITMHLAQAVLAQGKLYEANIHFDKIIHMTKVLYNQDHVMVYEAQFGIAQCFFSMGKIDQSKALLERCLYSMKDWRGSNHPIIGSILNKLGDIYNLLCRVTMAESLLKESWIIRMKTLKPCNENHPDLAENMLSLAENLRLRGIYDVISKPNKKKKTKSAESREEKKQEEKVHLHKEGDDIVEEELLDLPTSLPSKKASAQVKAAEDEEDEKLLSAVRSSNKVAADDEISAPTVAISTIEMLDGDDPEALDNGEGLENILPAGGIFDPMNLFNDEKMYKALPLVTKAIECISYYLDHDLNHPMILKGRFLLAEVMKNLGHYDKALEMHQVLFQLRRKLLGENHLETVTSVVAMGEILRMMKRVFSNTKGLSHTSAAVDGNYIGTGPKMSGNVTLLEHLVSVAKPVDRPKSAPNSLFNMDEDLDEGSDEDDSVIDPKKKMQKLLMSVSGGDWKFLTKIEEDEETKRKKRKPLPIPRGYMGYAFPAVKREARAALTADAVFGSGDGTAPAETQGGNGAPKRAKSAGGNGGGGGGGNNALLDPKKLIELAVSMLKKVFAAEDNGMNGYKKGDLYDHPLMALCLYNRAEIMRLRGDGLQALKILEQSLAMRRRLFRSHHPSIADCLYSMAELLRVDTRYPQALPIYDKALELREEAFGADHPSIAEIHNSLALIYIAQGHYDRAEEKIKLALQICVAFLGPDHPASISLYTNQAGLYQSMGKMKEAIIWCKKSLQNKQQFYGENHPETASTLNNLGLLYKSQNKYETALQMFHKALEIQRSILGNSHPEVATTYNNIGALLALQDGKKFEAKEYFKQSLGIRTMCYGETHALVASTQNNYACLLYSLNEISAAKDLFEKALQTRRTILTEDHPSIGESFHNLGYWYTMQHCYLDAKYHYEEALRIRKKAYGEENVLVATSALHLSNACDMLQEIESALQYAKESFNIRMKIFGGGHPETAMSEKQVTYLEHRLLHHQQQFSKLKSSLGSTAGSSASHSRPGTQGAAKRPASRVSADSLQFDLATGMGNDIMD